MISGELLGCSLWQRNLCSAETKGGKLPAYESDALIAAFFTLQSDDQEPDNTSIPGVHTGLIVVQDIHLPLPWSPNHLIKPIVVDSELELINELIDRVQMWDPDILAGWEVQSASWGYVARRMATYAGESYSPCSFHGLIYLSPEI